MRFGEVLRRVRLVKDRALAMLFQVTKKGRVLGEIVKPLPKRRRAAVRWIKYASVSKNLKRRKVSHGGVPSLATACITHAVDSAYRVRYALPTQHTKDPKVLGKIHSATA